MSKMLDRPSTIDYNGLVTECFHSNEYRSATKEVSMDFSRIQANLENLGYKVSCFDSAREATDYLDNEIDATSVGIGGSLTIDQMGLYERLATHNKVSWHWRIPEGMTDQDMRNESRAAKVYLSSVNGLAETGEIINIDGRCNRVASIFYGHEKVYLVIGKNKIAADYDLALDRARNIAAPLNAKRLGCQTPCAVKGDRCYDCKSDARICRGLSVLWEKPMAGDIEVILIDEILGY